jgi:Mg2+/citrate symporter
MFFVLAVIPFMVGCVLGAICFSKAIDHALFRVPYLWKLEKQKSISSKYAAHFSSRYKRDAWLWFIAIAIPSVAAGFLVETVPVAIPFLVGVGASLVMTFLDRNTSENDIRRFAHQHANELLSSGWWGTEEEAANDLVYNAKVEERLSRGDIFGGLRR